MLQFSKKKQDKILQISDLLENTISLKAYEKCTLVLNKFSIEDSEEEGVDNGFLEGEEGICLFNPHIKLP